ncbi:MAG: phosphotransferase [Deltaproteobacteria bacterium]|nr:phosphotransferase [Deltaproteobacteria bacterium]
MISSARETDVHTSAIKSDLARLLGRNVISVERIGGGRNNKVYRLDCDGSHSFAVKYYFRHGSDGRDRLDVEFSSLQLLWESGIRSIPRPLLADKGRAMAVYEYVDGKGIPAHEITDFDIDFAVQFLGKLKELKNAKRGGSWPLASEACFSVQAIIENIRERLERLLAVGNDNAGEARLRYFLKQDFMPAFDEIASWCRESLEGSRISFASDIGQEERTLSPSDFGFHNAVRCADGRIVFLDFEYFGWDDPAKMIADFLLHPAMDLSEGHKRRFATAVLCYFKGYRNLKKRTEVVYPLFALKWCTIVLNEFLPEHLLRRGFASVRSLGEDDLRAEQLLKAKRMLDRARNEYAHFLYFN